MLTDVLSISNRVWAALEPGSGAGAEQKAEVSLNLSLYARWECAGG